MIPSWLFSCTNTPSDGPDTPDTSDTTNKNASELLSDDRYVIVKEGASNYKIVRPEKGFSSSVLGAGAINDAIIAKCGVEVGVLMDDEPATEYEILVGDTNRPESSAAMSTLADNTYSISIVGNKIVIAAKSDLMLDCAINYFIESFIDTVPAVEGVFSFEKTMGHTSSSDFIVFDKPADGNYMVTYPNAEKEYQVFATYSGGDLYNLEFYANKVYNTLKDSKSAGVVISSDKLIGATEAKAEWKEILIGGTTREASKTVKANLDFNEYAIKVVDNDIVITGLGYVTTKAAVEKFLELIEAFKDDSTGKLLYRLPKDFYYKATSSEFSRWPNVPKYTGGTLDSVTSGGDESYVAVYTGTTKDEYTAYLTGLESQGYTKYFENDMNGNLYAVYKTDINIINAYFIPYSSSVYIVAEKTAKTTLPALESENQYTDKGIQSSVTQMKLNNVTNSNGQCHVFRLSDGRFIIVDGGGNDSAIDKKTREVKSDAENLLALMKDMTGGEKPVIAAWFITHLHGDHYNVLVAISKQYKDDVAIESFIYNFPPSEMSLEGTDEIEEKVLKAMRVFKGAKMIKAHTGQEYHIANAKIEMLFSPELIYPNYITFYNDASTVFMVEIDGTKTLITADASPNTSKIMCNMYGDYLKCDVLQISHHGSYGCSLDFYKYTNPSAVAFLPVGITQKARLTTEKENVYIAKQVKIIPHYEGTTTVDLPVK